MSPREESADAARCALAVMAKAPRTGQAKTRLLPRHAPADVVRLCECLLADTLALARRLDGVQVAVVCPAADLDEMRAFVGEEAEVVAQEGRGLAAALTFVFEHFAARGYGRVVALDADSPHLAPAVLQSAFEGLRDHDIVLGPTADGGYYLVGCRGPQPGLFDPMPLGTARALDALVARARGLRLSTSSTETAYDVDVPDDLERLAAELRAFPARAPRTARLLSAWRDRKDVGRVTAPDEW